MDLYGDSSNASIGAPSVNVGVGEVTPMVSVKVSAVGTMGQGYLSTQPRLKTKTGSILDNQLWTWLDKKSQL
jgi:hypothetical protein